MSTYAVIGVGGIGGYYGGRLANAGQEVHFLLHSDYEHVKANGLTVDSCEGNFHLAPDQINAYHQPQDMPQVDVVLVCLKTTQNGQIAPLVSPLLRDDTVIVIIQNGFGMEAEVAEAFPHHGICGSMAFICSTKIAPGHIDHADYGALTIGAYQNVAVERLAQIGADFQAAGIPTTVTDDLYTARWRKLVWNIPFNGLTVVLQAQTSDLLRQPDTRQLVRQLMTETVQAANASGGKIPETFIEQMMDYSDKMKPYSPSMYVDYQTRRPMELEYMYANPVREAERHDFAMPRTAMLLAQLRLLDERNLHA